MSFLPFATLTIRDAQSDPVVPSSTPMNSNHESTAQFDPFVETSSEPSQPPAPPLSQPHPPFLTEPPASSPNPSPPTPPRQAPSSSFSTSQTAGRRFLDERQQIVMRRANVRAELYYAELEYAKKRPGYKLGPELVTGVSPRIHFVIYSFFVLETPTWIFKLRRWPYANKVDRKGQAIALCMYIWRIHQIAVSDSFLQIMSSRKQRFRRFYSKSETVGISI